MAVLVPLICRVDEALMVGAVTDPVNFGLVRFDFKSRADCELCSLVFALALKSIPIDLQISAEGGTILTTSI